MRAVSYAYASVTLKVIKYRKIIYSGRPLILRETLRTYYRISVLLLLTLIALLQWLVNSRRSYSDSRLQNSGQLEYSCPCRLKNVPSIPESSQRTVFPSLTDVYLQKSGIANLSDSEENR